MKKMLLPIVVGALLIPLSALGASKSYTLDPNHTYVLWHVNHFGFSNPAGKWLAQGKLDFDQDNLQNSKVNVTINMADLDTGIDKLTQHLKSQAFLDVAKYPTATFVSDSVESSDNKTATIHGTLTVHGVSKPVTLTTVINKVGMSPVSNKETVGFTAHTVLKRSDFGVSAYLPGLGDEVKIEIEGEAN